MAKIVRMLVYEGNQHWIDETLSHSTPEGKLIVGKDREHNELSITALTFNDTDHLESVISDINLYMVGLLKHYVHNLYLSRKQLDDNV